MPRKEWNKYDFCTAYTARFVITWILYDRLREPWLRKTFFALSFLLNVGSLYKAWPENVLVGWCIIIVCIFYTLPTSKGTKFGHGFHAMQGRLWRRNGKEHDKARGDHGRFSLSLATSAVDQLLLQLLFLSFFLFLLSLSSLLWLWWWCPWY